MLEKYKTLLSYGEHEINIEKSRFICYAKPVESEEEAIKFIDEIKTKHWNATHNVPAYTIGQNNEIQRYSDDGEPSGTAGVPVLEVIKKEELKNLVLVVTRYFGGIKLGAGGLVRAYTRSAKTGLNAAKIVNKILYELVYIKIDYTLLGSIENKIIQENYLIKEIEYDDCVHLYVYIEINRLEEFENQITEWTSGTSKIVPKGKKYLTQVDGKVAIE